MLRSYIKSRFKSIAVWLVICVIFAAVFALYGLPLAAVLYAAALSGFAGIIFAAVDFIYYRRRIMRLRKAAEDIAYSVGELPDEDGAEGEYIRIINALYEKMRSSENEISAKYSDMNDYYTLWVHQIKTPIAAMSLILRNSDNSDTADLRENLQKIEQYTEMVLVFLRLDSEHSDYVIKEYDLDGIVRQAVKKFSSQFIRKKLKLTYEPLDKTVLTDEKWLLFVIEQIISNAVKYTQSGGVEIYCESPLTLCVKDTGIGISSEDLPRIFEKGYTGYNGRADKKASGIGLYLCRRICDKLGHEITAESYENGTIIKINLYRKSIETE